ncbi:MAG: two-component regulator propeller domain-containing protein [Acidobacteriota bacterium]|nr:two-component regulator propeller domain-containing protein [Acidobacteriota bacterium]
MPPAVLTISGKSGSTWRITTTEATERRGAETIVYKLDVGPINYNLNWFEDSTGHLWLGEYAVHRLGGGLVRRYGEADGLVRSIHHSFWEDPDGNVWFASGGGSTEGVGLVRHQDGQLQVFGAESGLLSTFVYAVFHDREGTTWLATNKGLARLRKKVISAYSVKDGLNNAEVYPIYRDRQNRIWIGTIRGLNIYENGRFTKVAVVPADPLAPADETWRDQSAAVQSLWEDPTGRMWVGINGGMFIIDRGTAQYVKAAKSHHVFAVRGDRQGNVWAATNQGILQFRESAYVKTLSVKDGLPNEFMTTIFEDAKGTLWFGGFGGLSRYADGKFLNYTTREGLVGSYRPFDLRRPRWRTVDWDLR